MDQVKREKLGSSNSQRGPTMGSPSTLPRSSSFYAESKAWTHKVLGLS